MFTTIHFPDAFAQDRFTDRRNGDFGSGNPYDPESLLTGEEISRGLDYSNSRRDWPDPSQNLPSPLRYSTIAPKPPDRPSPSLPS